MSRRHRALLVCLLLGPLLAPVRAQVATSPALGNPPLQTAPPSSLANSSPAAVDANGQLLASEEGAAVSPEPRRLHYELRLDVRAVYDDNIGLAPTNATSDYYFRIDPAIVVAVGDTQSREANFVRLEYDPDIVLFLDHSNFDTVQHVVHFDARANLSRLTIGVSETAQFLTSADVNQAINGGSFINAVNLDVRGRPSVNVFNTLISAGYELAGKTSLSANLQSSVRDYSQFVSSHVISGSLFLNYAYSPKITIGIGGTGGREFVDQPTPDQTFEQASVRASYGLSGKLVADGSVGIEFRQFESGRSDYISPVFNINLTYTPSDGSSFVLSGVRRTSSSGSLAGQDFNSTQFIGSWRQRVWDRFFFSLSGGYQNLTYIEAIAGISATRADNYYFILPAIDVRITRFWFAGAYYLHRQNDSSISIFGFNENQSGLRTTLVF